jgi:hypothetical protein
LRKLWVNTWIWVASILLEGRILPSSNLLLLFSLGETLSLVDPRPPCSFSSFFFLSYIQGRFLYEALSCPFLIRISNVSLHF